MQGLVRSPPVRLWLTTSRSSSATAAAARACCPPLAHAAGASNRGTTRVSSWLSSVAALPAFRWLRPKPPLLPFPVSPFRTTDAKASALLLCLPSAILLSKLPLLLRTASTATMAAEEARELLRLKPAKPARARELSGAWDTCREHARVKSMPTRQQYSPMQHLWLPGGAGLTAERLRAPRAQPGLPPQCPQSPPALSCTHSLQEQHMH